MDEKENTRELVVVDAKRYKRVKKALEESEERYRQLFENVPIGIYRTTPDGRIVDSNPALIKMLGFESFAQLSQRNLQKEYADPGSKRADFIKRLKREGEVIGLETIWKKKDGSPINVRENAKLTRTQEGEVFFEGTVEDITQSKQAEEAQRIRTQQIEILNCIISQGNLAESLADMLEVILDCMTEPLNLDTATIFLYDPGEKKMNLLASRGIKKNLHLKEKYLLVENFPFSKVLRGELVFVDNVPKTLPDLAKSWGWRIAASVPLVSNGKIVGAMNVASCSRSLFSSEEKNILELIGKEAGTLISKLQTETALRESEKYYRTLIDTFPDVIVVMDLEARMITVNQQFLKIGGYEYDEVIGASTYDFVEGLDRVSLKNSTAKFIKKKKMSGSEYCFKQKNGQAIPLEVSAGLLYDDAGQPTGIIAIGRDITERKRGEEQLRFLSSIAENITDSITVTDANFAITYINKVGENFFGYTLDELKGKTPGIFNAEPLAEQIQKKLYKIVSSGKTYLGESLNKRKDGSTFYCEYKVMPLRDSNGTIYAYSSVQSDISLRRHNEEVLRKSEDTFRHTFEAITDPAYVWTRREDGHVLLSMYNQAAMQITKGKIKNFLGAEVEKFFADYPNFVKKIKLAMDKGKRQFSEVFYKYQFTGESRWLQIDYVKTAENNVLVITKDITERKRDEQELRESKALLDAVVDNVPLMIFLKEATELRFVLFNRAGEELLGRNRNSMLGKNDADLFPAEQAAFFVAKDREVLDGESDMLDIPEEPIRTASKGQRLLHTHKVCIRGVDGTTKYLLGISEDITERKQAEAKLLAYQEQLQALTSEMILIEERERRRIASELHDQIGQNLALCKLKVAALEKNPAADEAMKGEMATIRRLLECSIQDARSLIFDLSPPILYELGLKAALEWLVERIQEQYHVQVEFESRSGGPELDNDRQVILFQVIRELLVNVGKHAQASQAKVILSYEKPFLKIQVNDDGVGFDASQVFAPKEKSGGYGFFSMRERLNYLGGSLEIKSKPGKGSQIILTLQQKVTGSVRKKEN